MLEKYSINSEVIKKVPAKWLIGGMVVILGVILFKPNDAQALTADDVLNKMGSKEQTAYISGVVGGFAYSRFLRDRPDNTGMDCIYNWFHGNNKKAWGHIDTWFERHLDKPAEPLLYVLIKKECGE